jgi:hypothetical protein
MSVLRLGAPPAGAGEVAREATAFAHGSPAVVAQLVANGSSRLVASDLYGRMARADASRGPDPEAATARHLERFKRLKSAGDDSGAALAADAAAAHMLQRIRDLEQSETAPALQARITALAQEIGYDPGRYKDDNASIVSTRQPAHVLTLVRPHARRPVRRSRVSHERLGAAHVWRC